LRWHGAAKVPDSAMAERRYRILVVASHPVQYMSPLLRRMAGREDVDLHVAYCSLRGAEAGHDPEFGATLQWDVPLLDGYAWTHIANRGSGAESFFGLWNPGIWKAIREGKFDAVLCHTGYIRATFWISWFAAKLSRTAFLFGTDTTTLAPMTGGSWKRYVKRLFWPILFRLADQAIVPSSKSRELLMSLGLPAERITLTPYVVDNDWWAAQSAQADRDGTRASWGVSAQDSVILFCAKLQPWKRPADLLEAFAKANLPHAILVIAGEGPLRSQLEAQTAALGIASRVRFLGFVNQSRLPTVYTAADLLVLPSGYEAFGVVVNEAMLCGCAVAASDHVGAVRDLIVHGRTGFVYPCGDVSALAAVLREATLNPPLLSAVRRAARARLNSWSPNENLAATVDAVSRAVSRVRRSAAATSPRVERESGPPEATRVPAKKISE
jgi:glycosyltransferase involved in cell wall biosynthesis